MESIITITVAFIAGSFALFQVKSNIITSSRISWIESLRETISLFCMEVDNCGLSKANMLDLSENEKTGNNFKELYSSYSNSSKEIEKLRNKIALYLNPQDLNHAKLEVIMNVIVNQVHNPNDQRNETKIHLLKLVDSSREILEKEYSKSKKIL